MVKSLSDGLKENDWVANVEEICRLCGATPETVMTMDNRTRLEFWRFRVSCLAEELEELREAAAPVEAVDAVIDLLVFGVGTLLAFGVDVREAWKRVHAANLQKRRGAKPERPNRFGLPDLIKPDGWLPPDHNGNIGFIPSELYPNRGDI